MVTTQQRFEQVSYSGTSPQILLIELWEENSQTMVHCAARHTDDVVHQGETYVRSDFAIDVPNSSSTMQTTSCSISNIQGIAGKAAIKPKSRIQIKIIMINLNDPDVRLWESYDLMVITGVSISPESVTGDMSSKANLLMPLPFRQFSSRDFPGSDLRT